jgi:hypothetical protein
MSTRAVGSVAGQSQEGAVVLGGGSEGSEGTTATARRPASRSCSNGDAMPGSSRLAGCGSEELQGLHAPRLYW